MDNAINDLLDALIPELGSLLSDMRLWMGVFMVIGPVLLLAFGAYYYFAPPKEANHKAGYRTYFGMGSIKAWHYTQRLAGLVWGIAGIAGAVAAIIGIILMATRDPADAVMPGLVILIIQAVAALVGFGFIEVSVAMHFDADGKIRK